MHNHAYLNEFLADLSSISINLCAFHEGVSLRDV